MEFVALEWGVRQTAEQSLGRYVQPQPNGCWIYTGPRKLSNLLFQGSGTGDAKFQICCILHRLDVRNLTNRRKWRFVASCGERNCVSPEHTELVEHDPSCRHCGHDMLGYSQYRVFCSERCAYTHRAEEAVEFARAAAEQLNLGEAAGWLRKLYRYLADRDGPSCSLCDKRVDLELSGTDDRMKPSVDHIVPRSKGGSNDLANLALAHLACNVAKGNRAQDEQLRLIG